MCRYVPAQEPCLGFQTHRCIGRVYWQSLARFAHPALAGEGWNTGNMASGSQSLRLEENNGSQGNGIVVCWQDYLDMKVSLHYSRIFRIRKQATRNNLTIIAAGFDRLLRTRSSTRPVDELRSSRLGPEHSRRALGRIIREVCAASSIIRVRMFINKSIPSGAPAADQYSTLP